MGSALTGSAKQPVSFGHLLMRKPGLATRSGPGRLGFVDCSPAKIVPLSRTQSMGAPFEQSVRSCQVRPRIFYNVGIDHGASSSVGDEERDGAIS